MLNGIWDIWDKGYSYLIQCFLTALMQLCLETFVCTVVALFLEPFKVT